MAFTVFYFGYQGYLQSKYPNMGVPREILEKGAEKMASEAASADQNSSQDSATQNSGSQSTTGNEAQLSETDNSAAQKIVKLSTQDLTFETPEATFTLDQTTGGFSSIYLKEYTNTLEDSANVNLVDESLILQALIAGENVPATGFQATRNENSITFSREAGAFLIKQTYTFDKEGYGARLNISYENTSDRTQNLSAQILMRDSMNNVQVEGSFLPGVPTGRPMLVVSADDDSDHHDALSYCEDLDEKGPIASATAANVNVVGLDRHYFVKALVAEGQKFSYALEKTPRSAGLGCFYQASIGRDFGLVPAGEKVSISLGSFFGPKDLETLKSYDAKLVDTIDLGFFAFISEPLLLAIKWFYGLTGNYGLAIILVTILIKFLFYPLTKSSAVAMHKNKILQPEMQKLREKYKNDTRRQQQELMAFMARNKINPMKGCLPLLPQMPVFFALYRILSTAIELRHAPFAGWITDLSAADPYYVTPLLWGATMFLQTKLTPNPGMDKNQQKIMMMMPAIFSVMMITLPSGMVLYMLANTVVSIGQQKWLNMKLEQNDASTKKPSTPPKGPGKGMKTKKIGQANA